MSTAIHDIISRRAGEPDLVSILAENLTLSELNTLLLEVFYRQTRSLTPAKLLAAYRQNRYVHPAAVDPVAFREFELLWLKAAREQGFTPEQLSPLAPLGCCSVVGTVHQNKIISATRGAEIVADATNMLALESVVGRRNAGFSPEPVHLCAAHRHVRAQALGQPGFTAHFGVFCLTSAGRDTGSFQFEQENIVRHIRFYQSMLTEPSRRQNLKIVLKALDPDSGANLCFERIREHLATAIPEVEIETIRLPQNQQGYYHALQFGIVWEHNGRPFPIADGGFTTWTQQLCENRKERFLGSGIGLELLWKVLNGLI